MIKIFILFLFSLKLLSNDNFELQLYEKILKELFENKTVVIYADNESKQIIKNSNQIQLTNDCTKSDILFGKEFDNLEKNCEEKPLFATSYNSYKTSSNVIGAFYWRKGRPQIRFNKDVLEKFNLKLPKEFQRYAK